MRYRLAKDIRRLRLWDKERHVEGELLYFDVGSEVYLNILAVDSQNNDVKVKLFLPKGRTEITWIDTCMIDIAHGPGNPYDGRYNF